MRWDENEWWRHLRGGSTQLMKTLDANLLFFNSTRRAYQRHWVIWAHDVVPVDEQCNFVDSPLNSRCLHSHSASFSSRLPIPPRAWINWGENILQRNWIFNYVIKKLNCVCCAGERKKDVGECRSDLQTFAHFVESSIALLSFVSTLLLPLLILNVPLGRLFSNELQKRRTRPKRKWGSFAWDKYIRLILAALLLPSRSIVTAIRFIVMSLGSSGGITIKRRRGVEDSRKWNLCLSACFYIYPLSFTAFRSSPFMSSSRSPASWIN